MEVVRRRARACAGVAVLVLGAIAAACAEGGVYGGAPDDAGGVAESGGVDAGADGRAGSDASPADVAEAASEAQAGDDGASPGGEGGGDDGSGDDGAADAALDAGPDAPAPDGGACLTNSDCAASEFCLTAPGTCGGAGTCQPVPASCPGIVAKVCGCDGTTYANYCYAHKARVSIKHAGHC
jgi:hypothetical protein